MDLAVRARTRLPSARHAYSTHRVLNTQTAPPHPLRITAGPGLPSRSRKYRYGAAVWTPSGGATSTTEKFPRPASVINSLPVRAMAAPALTVATLRHGQHQRHDDPKDAGTVRCLPAFCGWHLAPVRHCHPVSIPPRRLRTETRNQSLNARQCAPATDAPIRIKNLGIHPRTAAYAAINPSSTESTRSPSPRAPPTDWTRHHPERPQRRTADQTAPPAATGGGRSTSRDPHY
jgi:hypothetical protein